MSEPLRSAVGCARRARGCLCSCSARAIPSSSEDDQFFYLNDPVVNTIRQTYGITYRHTLAEVIKLDTGVTVPANVFKAG
jgi:hypothetical protein